MTINYRPEWRRFAIDRGEPTEIIELPRIVASCPAIRMVGQVIEALLTTSPEDFPSIVRRATHDRIILRPIA